MKSLFPVLILLCFAPTPREEAVVIDWDVRWIGRDPLQKQKEIQRRERVTIQGDRMRIEDQTFGMIWLVRADQEKVWVIDSLRREYSELTFEAIRKRQTEIADDIALACRHVAGTQEEKELQGILRGMGRYTSKPDVAVKETGKKEKLLGRDCTERSLVVGGDVHRVTVFVDPTLKEGAAYFDLLAKMGGFSTEEVEALPKLEGVPVQGVIRYLFFADRVTVDVKARRVERTSVDPSLFEPPQGLQKVPLKEFEATPSPQEK